MSGQGERGSRQHIRLPESEQRVWGVSGSVQEGPSSGWKFWALGKRLRQCVENLGNKPGERLTKGREIDQDG